VDKKIKENEKIRLKQIEKRRAHGCKTAAIVGYTNAGKTTLFNTLTGKVKRAEDRLFATLDNVTGKLYLPSTRETILLSDTIGFIQKLPPALITAFKSTLMASIHADLLLHVVDVADPHLMEKIRTVEEILRDLDIGEKKQILVLNKADLISEDEKKILEERFAECPHLFFSNLTKEKDVLLQSIITSLCR
jgi:GTPase